jgi:glycerate 2-kinase
VGEVRTKPGKGVEMKSEHRKKIRSDAEAIFKESLRAVDPYNAVKRFVHVEGKRLTVGTEDVPNTEIDLADYERIFLVGGGKATAPMAKAVEELLGKRISRGMINVKYGFSTELTFTRIMEANHPLPDANGVEGTRKMLDLLNSAGEKDLVFSLISGGGSALLVHPAGDITMEEIQDLTQMLLECGATIDEINSLRKHISSIKGGRMAQAAYPATTVNLMLSDVVGDNMDVIASGPFVPDRSTFQDAWKVIEKYNLKNIPHAIQTYLQSGIEGHVQETPKAGENIFLRVHNFVIGSNILALRAAEEKAKDLGYNPLILSSMIEGETKEVAGVHVAIAREIVKTATPISPPACIISGGETTVTIKGNGLGGRNQEFCLAAAMEMDGLPASIAVLSGGTDGDDGPTKAAGAIVDPHTVERGRALGLEASEFLSNNDSYHFLEKTEDLLVTGPTGTNVMDVRLVLVGN